MKTRKQIVEIMESVGAEKAHVERSGQIKGMTRTYGEYTITQDKESKIFRIWLNSSSWSNRKKGAQIVQLLKDEPNVEIADLDWWMTVDPATGKEA